MPSINTKPTIYLKERESALSAIPPIYVNSSHVLPLPVCRRRSGVEPGVLSLRAAHYQEVSVHAQTFAEPIAGPRLRRDARFGGKSIMGGELICCLP